MATPCDADVYKNFKVALPLWIGRLNDSIWITSFPGIDWFIYFPFILFQKQKKYTAILEDADLSKTTSKIVRITLEKKLECDLLARKKEIDDLVMEFAQSQVSDNDDAESEEDQKPPKRAAAPSSKKRKQSSSDDLDSDSDSNKRKKKKPAAKKAKAKDGAKPKSKGTGFTRPYKLSADLAAVVGADALPRHEVVKKVWAIIKSRNLYDPKNKQFAICDAELQKVMGVKRFRTFGMLKYLKNHFIVDWSGQPDTHTHTHRES